MLTRGKAVVFNAANCFETALCALRLLQMRHTRQYPLELLITLKMRWSSHLPQEDERGR